MKKKKKNKGKKEEIEDLKRFKAENLTIENYKPGPVHVITAK